ncbi:unnamed protein product [Cochlearia groenlandica]
MAGTNGNDEEDKDCFFDAPEDNTTSSASHDSGLNLWNKNPESVSNRRQKFLQSMGFSFNKNKREDSSDTEKEEEEDKHSDTSSSTTSVSESINATCNDKGKEIELLSRNDSTTSSVFDTSSVSSRSSSSSSDDTSDQTLFSRSGSCSSSSMPEGLSESSSTKSSFREDSTKKGAQSSWLKKLGVLTHVLDSIDIGSKGPTLKQNARVSTSKKQFKELSSMCVEQDFAAHDGSILAMKFSHLGKYIATAGEDCVVRVWKITEEERKDEYEVAETVDSCVYFGMNQDSQIESLGVNNEKVEKKTSLLRKSSNSTCVVLPSKIFCISEKPVHEFRGHAGEVLDLSWSEKGYLLSSSVDKTVRLWRVGTEECLGTFSHNNYVTCVAFNPVDDKYFVSGCIDGKVRMWDVSRFRVVDYTDLKDIVTAVCYGPDAKSVVIGSMTGICRFYHILDNQMQMDREINLHGKKKVANKRITGLQFVPNDSIKVMVTSADSHIRIISGEDVICKLKASSLHTTSANFVEDGKHIVSTTEDSGIHLWNYSQSPSKKLLSGKLKSVRSYEGFVSHNASVAIPWLRQGHRNMLSDCVTELEKNTPKMDCFAPMKGSTTWPEEKLEEAAKMSSREKVKALKSVWQPHLWGLVIVTATWDGRIRVFSNYGLPALV